MQIVREAKRLGISLTDNLSFDKHVNAVLTVCSQRFYLLKILQDELVMNGKKSSFSRMEFGIGRLK